VSELSYIVEAADEHHRLAQYLKRAAAMAARLWTEPDSRHRSMSTPLRDEPGILAGCHTAVRAATAGEQELAGPFGSGLEIVIDRLAGLLAQFKSDRPPSFLLPDRCAIRRVPAGSDTLYPDDDDITATKLAVDCQIEHGEVASAVLDLELCPDRPGVFGSQRWLCPVSFPLFRGTRLGFGVAFT
jgi:hypothetical protein